MKKSPIGTKWNQFFSQSISVRKTDMSTAERLLFMVSKFVGLRPNHAQRKTPIWKTWRDTFSKSLGIHEGNGFVEGVAFESGNELTPSRPWNSIDGFGAGDEEILYRDLTEAFGATKVPLPSIDPADSIERTIENIELWAFREGFGVAEIEYILKDALACKGKNRR